jgi:hypothetical protein
MVKAGKTLKNLLYSIPVALATIFLPGCEPDPLIKDVTPPKISMYSPLEGKVYKTNTVPLEYSIFEENFKDAWYSIDNGAKVSLDKSGTKNIDLTDGDHKLTIGAEDLSNNYSEDKVNFSVNKEVIIPPKDTIPPKVDIISPLEKTVYNTNDVSLSWNVDEENFKNAWYTINNGIKNRIEKSGTQNINLENGNYKIVVGAEDISNNSSKDSVNFSIDKHSWLYLVNPFVQPDSITKPKIWNNFSTTSQRNAYLNDRLYNYDKTDTMTYIPGKFVCTDFASLWATNFNGYRELGFDPEKGLQNNGWHNIPAYTVTLMKPGNFHAIGAVMIKDNAVNPSDWRFIETETDSTYNLNTFNQWGVYKIILNQGVSRNNGEYLSFQPFFEFIPDGNGGWKDSGYRNPEINLITQRGK